MTKCKSCCKNNVPRHQQVWIYETALLFSILSFPTDDNGYFLTKLCYRLKDTCKITQCKVFLKNSPLDTCQFLTNVNNRSNGDFLSAYRHVKRKKNIRLYFVGPFVCTSKPKTTSFCFSICLG